MSFTLSTDDFKDRDDVYHRLARMGMPFLFQRKRALYIGCRHTDRALVDELKEAGVELDLLEIYEPNARYFEKYEPDIFRRVIIGDATSYTPDEYYDAIIWWMGPEHAQKQAALNGLKRLEQYCDLLAISVPNGMCVQGPIDGNQYERHVSTWTKNELMNLGFAVLSVGKEHGGGLLDFLIGWIAKMTHFEDPDAPVQAHQMKTEFEEVLKEYDKLNPRTIVEIGIQRGGTLYQWMKHAEPGAKIIAVDKFDTGSPIYEWADKFEHELHLIRGVSQSEKTYDEVTKYANGGIDFLFIDGDHATEMVKLDYEMYAPLVRKGGVIVMHDIARSLKDDQKVYLFWETLDVNKREIYEFDINQQVFGTGIIYV